MISLPRSLQGRVLALVLSLVAVVWFGTSTLTWFDAHRELDELLDAHLAQAAALLVVQQSHEGAEEEQDPDSPTLHRYAPTVVFQVFHEGRLTLRSASAPDSPMLNLGANNDEGFGTVSIAGSAWRVFATRAGDRDLQVFVGEQMGARSSILWAVMRSTLWPTLLALPLLSLAIWWAVRQGVDPLTRLERQLAERHPEALTPVSVEGTPTEMEPMLIALNGLFSRIDTLIESERRFTADAAHELRTPIAAIRTQAQVAMGESDDVKRKHALQSTLAGCDRAARLVEQLLTLSQLDAGVAPSLVRIELNAVVREAIAELVPFALGKRQLIEFDDTENCTVRGDVTLISVLVRNLVDNAIRYSPPGGRVRVALTRTPSDVHLEVQDSGPGLSPADMARVGERFFRVVGSGQSGSGLGWSIIRRIVTAHRAVLQIGRSPELGGLMVDVTWDLRS